MRRATRSLAVLAIWALSLHAQAPVQSLRVQGNREIPSEKIIAVSGLNIGRTVRKDDFEAARNRLIETGAFETVGYEYKPSADSIGFDVVLNVVETGPLYPYRFEDLPMPEDALRAALRQQEPLFADRIPPVAAIINRYVKAIQQATGLAGAVIGKLSSESPNDLAIVFRPATPRSRVAEFRFEGNDALPSDLLLRTISEVAIGIEFTEQAVRLRLDAAIRALYDARGRIRVSFPKIASEPSSKVDGVVVTVTVIEGPVYNLGSVRYAGVASTEVSQLEKTADLKKGDIANFDDINAGLARVYKRYRGTGYLHVAGSVERDIHDDSHTVDLSVAIDLGPQYHFGKLDIVGLDILSEPEIRNAYGALEGKPFQPDYPDGFLARLREEGVFDNLGKTRSETHVDEVSKTVDVTLYFSRAAQATKSPAPRP
jgi:outer membrane protein insertion porin family